MAKLESVKNKGYDLIISEKPSAAKRIALALSDGKPSIIRIGQVSAYKFTHNGKQLIVVPAVGHLYTVAEKNKSFSYPVFEVDWKPVFEVDKKSSYAKKYWKAIKSLAQNANELIIACDYDVEGEVIGFNAMRFIANRQDASRMKFSTLTKHELIQSYEERSKTINWGQAIAGETRHILDWFYGINLSRALMTAAKNAGKFAVYSIGRVQGPALKLVVDRELAIKSFKPTPFWVVSLLLRFNGKEFKALHVKEKFLEKQEAVNIVEKVRNAKPFVSNVEEKVVNVLQPTPFDLTTLQMEAYKWLRLTPAQTLSIAQELYLQGLISYPRTSSQKLPASIGYSKILNALQSNGYASLTRFAVNKNPRQGSKQDPAHPAIYPTGLKPEGLNAKQLKLYELIVKRFIACFANPAKKKVVKLLINANNELFKAEGAVIVEKGWMNVYPARISEEELPVLNLNTVLDLVKVLFEEKQTQPPKRFTQASLVKELEKKGLGTKATRAQVVSTLYDRGYIVDDPIKATELGVKTVEILEKHAPEILDEALTRQFEQDLEGIMKEQKTKEEVLSKAKALLINTLKKFKLQEREVGVELSTARKLHEDKQLIIGKCPNCGGDLRILKSKKSKKRFVACSNYPECKTIYPLPQTGMVKPTSKVCEHCKAPIIKIVRKGRKPLEVCVNPECDSRRADEKTQALIDSINNGVIVKKCPKCGAKLVVRHSVYGSFLACSNYPKCKYTEPLNVNNS